MPSAVLLYDLGRATHRDDDYRIITAAIWQVGVLPTSYLLLVTCDLLTYVHALITTAAIWQSVLRSNQRPRVLLKTLMLLEAVLLHGPDRALEETIDMKNDIKALQKQASPPRQRSRSRSSQLTRHLQLHARDLRALTSTTRTCVANLLQSRRHSLTSRQRLHSLAPHCNAQRARRCVVRSASSQVIFQCPLEYTSAQRMVQWSATASR